MTYNNLHQNVPHRILLAITGASGHIYAKKLIDRFIQHFKIVTQKSPKAPYLPELDIIMSTTAQDVWIHELGNETPTQQFFNKLELSEFIQIIDNNNFNNRNASGSNCADVMIILPTSMGTIGRIAAGTADSLILRAADVILKERKHLIITPRETPLNLIHLRNLTTLSEAGATVFPASPSFYLLPKSMDEMADMYVDRLLRFANIHLDSITSSKWSAAHFDAKD